MDEQQFQAEVMRSLGKLEASIDALQAQLTAHDSRVIQITARVTALENWRARVIGIVVGIAALVGVAANWLGKKIGL